jgi:hypothetical protein
MKGMTVPMLADVDTGAAFPLVRGHRR